MSFHSDASARAAEYASRHDLSIEKQLGAGYDGIVVATTSGTAIKALRFEALYRRERDVYRHLSDLEIDGVQGFHIPQLVRADDELWVVEMQIVSPPFVLDFAGASLFVRPEYDDDVIEEWTREKEEQFGERWDIVQSVLAEFRGMGIFLTDVKPGNIAFDDDDPDSPVV